MGGNSFSVQVAIHNKTITDITTMVVSPDKPSMKPFTVPIPAGNSHELELSERQCKVSIKTTFRNGAKDNFNIFLDSEQQSLIKIEKEIETHSISVQQDNKKVTLTFENTRTQTENHEAERIYQEAKILIIKEKFNEASAKLDEALEKGNETKTITAILASISDLEKNRTQKATLMRDEGLKLLSQNNYEEALNKFTHCLKFAKERTIITSIHDNISKIDKMKESQDKCEEIVRQAKTLSSQHRYKEALKKFEEALTYAQKKETVLAIIKSMNEVEGVRKSQEKSEEIVNVAETLLGKHLYGEALKKFEEALIFAKKKQTVELIKSNINKTRRLKVDQDKAEKIKKQAEALMEEHKYKLALSKFYYALKYTHKDIASVKENIAILNSIKKKERKALELNKEAEALLEDHCYNKALWKIEEALKLTKNPETLELIKSNKTRVQQEDNDSTAIKLNAEGLLLEDAKAIKKFNQALKIAREETLINHIKMNKAKVFNKQGEGVLAEVRTAEEQRFAEVAEKLAHAKNLFMLANDVYPSRKYEDNIKIVDSKIRGNKFYKAGVKFEEKAALLVEKIESSSVEEAISKYISVRECYKNALEEFTEGMKINEEKFKFSVGVVNAALNGVTEVLDGLEWRKLH